MLYREILLFPTKDACHCQIEFHVASGIKHNWPLVSALLLTSAVAGSSLSSRLFSVKWEE